jgi:hypothetical protein
MLLNGSNLPIVVVLGFLAALTARNIFALVKKKKRAVYRDTSLLLSFYTRDRQLRGVANLEADDTTVTYFVAQRTAITNSPGETNSTFIAMVQLPFSTGSHIVGITQKAGMEFGLPEYLAGRDLERIALEGDFPDTFMLYGPPGNQLNSRYLLDPVAMAFVVDYCQSQHFEIVDDMLYVASNDATQKAETAGEGAFAAKTIGQFIEAIRPAVEEDPDHQTASLEARRYGNIRQGVKCPRCRSALANAGSKYVCSNGDGLLLTGKTLLDLKRLDITRAPSETSHNLGVAELKCPNCGSDMYAVDYQMTGNIIDACTVCGCRWLDQDEATAILHGSNNQ